MKQLGYRRRRAPLRGQVFWVNDAAVPDAQVALCVFEPAGDFARRAARGARKW